MSSYTDRRQREQAKKKAADLVDTELEAAEKEEKAAFIAKRDAQPHVRVEQSSRGHYHTALIPIAKVLANLPDFCRRIGLVYCQQLGLNCPKLSSYLRLNTTYLK